MFQAKNFEFKSMYKDLGHWYYRNSTELPEVDHSTVGSL